MSSDETFVEYARREADASPREEGEEPANRLLAQARESIYFWPAEFAGFEAGLRLELDGILWKGQLSATDSHHFQFEWDEEPPSDVLKWLRYQVGELLAHREAPTRSKMASQSGVLLGEEEPVFGTEVVFPNDPMESSYRLKDRRITQIARAYKGARFVINIDTHHDFGGRYAAQCYTAFYWDKGSGALQKVETFYDDYQAVQGLHLPSVRRYTMAAAGEFTNRRLVFFGHRLL